MRVGRWGVRLSIQVLGLLWIAPFACPEELGNVVDSKISEYVRMNPGPSRSLKPESGMALRVAPECDHEVMLRVQGNWYLVGLLHNRWRVVVSTREFDSVKKKVRLSAAFSSQKKILDVWSDPTEVWPSELNEACRGLALEDYRPISSGNGAPQTILLEMVRTFGAHHDSGTFDAQLKHERMQSDTWTGATP